MLLGAGCVAPAPLPQARHAAVPADAALDGFIEAPKDIQIGLPVMPGMKFTHGRVRALDGKTEYFIDYSTYETPKTVGEYYSAALRTFAPDRSSEPSGRTGWEYQSNDGDAGTTFTLTLFKNGVRAGFAQIFIDSAMYSGHTSVMIRKDVYQRAGDARHGA